jgi:hypothetical protein
MHASIASITSLRPAVSSIAALLSDLVRRYRLVVVAGRKAFSAIRSALASGDPLIRPRPLPPCGRMRSPGVATRAPEPWAVEFFQRHVDDDADETVPAQAFLDDVPDRVAAKIVAVVQAVAAAPPPAFSGGGMWEAMHDEMAGTYEVRVDYNGVHYRLFCVLERDGANVGLTGPSIVLIDGRSKKYRTTISTREYKSIRSLVDEYLRRRPRSVLGP